MVTGRLSRRRTVNQRSSKRQCPESQLQPINRPCSCGISLYDSRLSRWGRRTEPYAVGAHRDKIAFTAAPSPLSDADCRRRGIRMPAYSTSLRETPTTVSPNNLPFLGHVKSPESARPSTPRFRHRHGPSTGADGCLTDGRLLRHGVRWFVWRQLRRHPRRKDLFLVGVLRVLVGSHRSLEARAELGRGAEVGLIGGRL